MNPSYNGVIGRKEVDPNQGGIDEECHFKDSDDKP